MIILVILLICILVGSFLFLLNKKKINDKNRLNNQFKKRSLPSGSAKSRDFVKEEEKIDEEIDDTVDDIIDDLDEIALSDDMTICKYPTKEKDYYDMTPDKPDPPVVKCNRNSECKYDEYDEVMFCECLPGYLK